MTQPLVNAGLWWRFDRYEVEDGVVRPAARAQLAEYSPWDHYRPIANRRQRSGAPYGSLLELVPGDLAEWQQRRYTYSPTRTEARRIADWCSKFGLLGVALHRADRLVLHPRWEYDEAGGLLGPAQSTFIRRGWGWDERRLGPELGRHHQPASSATVKAGEPVDAEIASEWKEPRLRIRQLDPTVGTSADPEWREEPLGRTWARYFRDVPPTEVETYQYPDPLSREFWEQYQEPVPDFIEAVTVLRSAIEWAKTGFDPSLPWANRWRSLLVLRDLVDTTRQMPIPTDDGGVTEVWAAPSLLGALASMALRDLSGGGKPLRCARCAAVFVAGSERALYCSERCRTTQKRARLRRRQRGAEA